jgi:hypothetical protein
MRRTPFLLAACLAALALPAAAEDLSATLGKQRAAASKVEWEVKEAGHPRLGNIRFAYVKSAIETPVGNAKVYSRAYLSCQRASRKFAIELTNTTAPDDPGGLQPAEMPRLTCVRPTAPGQQVQEELLANWDVDPKLGDALTSGFRAFPLRECASIRVEQQVALPAGWAQKTARVEFEILPYQRALDSIFVACGERSAYAPAAAPPATVASKAPAPAGPPRSPPPPARPAAIAPAAGANAPSSAPVAESRWQMARVDFSGKTNVRAGPRIDSSIVTQLDPGSVVLVQRAENDWWRARPAKGASFSGYIREDRLSFR